MKLNIGCGKEKLKGYINTDLNKNVKPDMVIDLNKKLPFKDNSIEEIIAFHILEHLDDVIFTLNELYRISKNKAIIKIKVPHFASTQAFTDLSHKHPFGLGSLDYVATNGGELHKKYGYEYGNMIFKIIEKKIEFPLNIKKIKLDILFNNHQTFWEQKFSYIFQADFLSFKLEVIKKRNIYKPK